MVPHAFPPHFCGFEIETFLTSHVKETHQPPGRLVHPATVSISLTCIQPAITSTGWVALPALCEAEFWSWFISLIKCFKCLQKDYALLLLPEKSFCAQQIDGHWPGDAIKGSKNCQRSPVDLSSFQARRGSYNNSWNQKACRSGTYLFDCQKLLANFQVNECNTS